MKRAKINTNKTTKSFVLSEGRLLSGIEQVNLGVVASLLGNYDQALSHYHRARSHFEEEGDLARLALMHYKCGLVLLAKGAKDNAMSEFDLAASFGTKIASSNIEGLAKLGKANAFYELGDIKVALRLANQALRSFSIHEAAAHLADAYLLKGKIHRTMKRVQFAEWYFNTSLKIHDNLKNQFGRAGCYRELGILYRQCGSTENARRALQKSLESFKSIGATADVQRVVTELCSIGGKTGDETRRTR